jgi:hypothetical protein
VVLVQTSTQPLQTGILELTACLGRCRWWPVVIMMSDLKIKIVRSTTLKPCDTKTLYASVYIYLFKILRKE